MKKTCAVSLLVVKTLKRAIGSKQSEIKPHFFSSKSTFREILNQCLKTWIIAQFLGISLNNDVWFWMKRQKNIKQKQKLDSMSWLGTKKWTHAESQIWQQFQKYFNY